MTTKYSALEREQGMALAAWDWWAAAETSMRCKIRLEMSRAVQKGTLQLEMVASDLYADAEFPLRAKVTRTWPNSSPQSLGACIFEMVCSIDRMIDEHALDVMNDRRREEKALAR